MYKLVIVDDEPLIIKRIKKLIKWEQLNIGNIYSTTDGDEAVAVCAREKAEIVITDIKMPLLTGLELIEKIASMDHTTEFIIISGFDDFQYAKQAMRFGVRSYLLKPIDENELNEALTQSIRSYESKKQMLHNMNIFNHLNIVNDSIKTPVSGNVLVLKMIEIIEQNYAGPLTLKSLSESINVNSTYAGQLFRKETGMLFNDYISIIRIRKAMEQLSSTNRIIADISIGVGYQDTSQFYKVFKKITGMNPSEFRDMMSGK